MVSGFNSELTQVWRLAFVYCAFVIYYCVTGLDFFQKTVEFSLGDSNPLIAIFVRVLTGEAT